MHLINYVNTYMCFVTEMTFHKVFWGRDGLVMKVMKFLLVYKVNMWQ